MRSRFWPPLLGAATGALAIASASPARGDSNAHSQNASVELVNVDREIPAVQSAVDQAKREQMSVEERLANGELLYRMKDYQRAALVFSEVIEAYPDTPSYPDALWLRGETYYASHEYLSARRDYRALVARGSEPRFQGYLGKALARLVDVSLRLGDVQALDEVFAKLGQVPPAQVDAGLNYAKGKAYYVKKDFSNAQSAFAAVSPGTQYTHQARYFQGVLAMKLATPVAAAPVAAPATGGVDGSNVPPPTTINYKPAIDTFLQVTQLPPDSDDHRHVIDLAWMAIGRLFYEMEQYDQAADAYSKVGRESPEFDTMLYELAWVYVRLGDVDRAERALEVLQIADPDSPLVGDGTLLRADLLLRAGAYDKALELYEGVRNEYEPQRAKVEAFLDQTKDVSVYYDKLAQQQLDALDQNEQLPPLAIRWAREGEDGPAAFAVIDDVNECRTLIKRGQRLVERLTSLAQSSNRVHAFPELEAGEEASLGLINRVSRARLEIAHGLDDDEAKVLGGEILDVSNRRRALMGQVAALPMTSADFNARDQQGLAQWNKTSQDLTNRGLEVDQLQAVINGLRRLLKEDAQRGVARDPVTIQQWTQGIDEVEHDLKVDRQQVELLHREIDFGRAQVGLGDSRYQSDAVARSEFRDLLEREVQLASQGQGGPQATGYAQRVSSMLTQARSEEDRLVAAFKALEAQVAARSEELRQKVLAESANLQKYAAELDALDNGPNGARDVVGHVAQRNFVVVRDKLRGIILRADVGITEQAWEVREEELTRVHNLQTERAREEQLLDEELREVLDDANESTGSQSK